MKNNYLYPILVLLLGFGLSMAGCDDNSNISNVHILTQEEIDEMARQDSILNEQKNKINADLILEYDVSLTISQTSYDGTSLTIDTDAIAEIFEITVEELLAGIDGESGAPEVKGFAIQGSTHADDVTASNTNSPWGHWWDANGDITTWGTSAMVFAEFDTETSAFAIGQYPAHLTDGQKITIIECLKYNEIRVAVVINITAKGLEEIKAAVVNTQNLNLTIYPKSDYTQVSLQFNLTQTLSDLGIRSMDDVQYIAVNADGSYAQEPATTNGYWFDANGFVVAYGDDARLYTTYGEEDFADECIGVGQMPNTLTEGDVITFNYGFLANSKIELLKVVVTVVPYEDPETVPSGTPESVTNAITFTKAYTDTYNYETIDVKDVLRDAFKMTTYQIHKAINSGELKVYLNESSEEAPTYTSDVPGYWIDADGKASEWSTGIVWCSIGHTETELYLYSGNHPGNCSPNGQEVITNYIVMCNGVSATFNIIFKITAKE